MIWMHDLLQQMGRGIVFDESKQPGKRSRIWIPKEASDVSRKNKVKKCGVHLVCPQGQKANSPTVRGQSSSSENCHVINDDALRQSSYQGMSDCGGFEQRDSAVKLFGVRLELNKKYSVPSSSNEPNAQVEDSTMHTNLAEAQGFMDLQLSVACAPPSAFGCSSAACVPDVVPCMVGSRGAPAVPHILDMSMNFLTLEMNGLGPTRTGFDLNGGGSTCPGFDLNSNLMMVEDVASELGGSRPGQSLLEESMWSTPYQCLRLGLRLK